MSGRSSKVKGASYEREVVQWHRERGVFAERVPLSGAAKGSYGGDLRIGEGLTAECKRRARAFGALYAAIDQDDADILFVRDDRRETLVVLPLATYERLLERIHAQGVFG